MCSRGATFPSTATRFMRLHFDFPDCISSEIEVSILEDLFDYFLIEDALDGVFYLGPRVRLFDVQELA